MKAEYWLQRWNEGRIGWHRGEVMPLLEKHWSALGVPRGARVLVPLCGKSLDMLWLARQGMQVVGVEISPIAVESFLAENHLRARTRTMHGMTKYVVTNPPEGGGIEIVNGDMFEVDASAIAACNAFYDRAATIALPAPNRERLANEVYAKLPAGSRGLLITLDYPEHEMQGPPFSVDEAEVFRLFDAQWKVERLDRRDILASQPSFSEQGVTALHTAVHALARRAE
ncbi:MAG TPA: thiopurine S-methyltransferase [Rhodanobacteraceae bacterium]